MDQKYPIRILQYIGSLNIGGSQSMIMEIYRKIDKSKIQFDFIIDRKNENFYEKEIVELGGKVYKFDNYFRGINILKYKKQWKNFFKEHYEYEIIHCHVRSVASIALKIAKKYQLKTICHSHSTSNGNGIKAIVKKLFQRNIPKYADYLFACSKDSAIWLYGRDESNSDRCYIINNAINFEKFIFNEKNRKKIRDKYNISNDDVLLGHVGRFVDVKNHIFLIDIIEQLVQINSKYKMMLVGDGILKTKIQRIANEKNIADKIIFIDSSASINEYYSAFDIFLFPSKYEGLGMAIIEAQISGLYCIASNTIPADTRITESIEYCDLNKKIWIEKIQKFSKGKHNVFLKDVEKFDINNNVKFLETFYMNKLI